MDANDTITVSINGKRYPSNFILFQATNIQDKYNQKQEDNNHSDPGRYQEINIYIHTNKNSYISNNINPHGLNLAFHPFILFLNIHPTVSFTFRSHSLLNLNLVVRAPTLRGSSFLIISKDSKIPFFSIGHPEISPEAKNFEKIQPRLFFTIGKSGKLFMVANYDRAWEYFQLAIYDLNSKPYLQGIFSF